MANTRFPHLFSPLSMRGVTLENRILSTGHETNLAVDGVIGEDLAAYHGARAAGGAGLIIIEVSTVHETAIFTRHPINAEKDASIPGYRRVAEACHPHGAKVFGQLFHPGREIVASFDGSAPVSVAPSATPNERFHVMPAPMSRELIAEVVAGFGDGARRMKEAGLDGIEVLAGFGYLGAQFLNPRINTRTDQYGGSLENRLRFLREVFADIRAKIGEDMVLGIRVSGDESSNEGLSLDEMIEICVALDGDGEVDYFSVNAGSSATLAGSIHIVPPMIIENAYTAPYAAAIRARVSKPVFVTGRINQPQEAEKVLAAGDADVCGMTRAMICDPEMPRKAAAGHLDHIRACVGCNQACIGHFLAGYPISCIQYPESGRELTYGARKAAPSPRSVLIAGGGPGGMKAAAVAAERGHQVTLCEAGRRLGGQVLLAQLLPGRAEFGGIVDNLTREMERAGVEVATNTPVDRALIDAVAPDVVVVATGARPRKVAIEGADEGHVVEAWQVLRDEANVGASVVIADWRCDWIGLGLAEKLVRDGCRVRLCVNGTFAGQMIQQYVRDYWVGILHKLGVEIIPYARLFGVDSDTVYMQHTMSGEPIILDGVDTLVTALGHEPVNLLRDELADWPGDVHFVGDCLSPRTVEEAVLEGLRVATAL